MRSQIFGPHCMCSCGAKVWNIILVVMWNDECSVGIRHIAPSQRVKVLEVCYDSRLDDTTWHCRIFKAESLSVCDNALLICKAPCSLTLPSTSARAQIIEKSCMGWEICAAQSWRNIISLSISFFFSWIPPLPPTLPWSPLSALASSAWVWMDGNQRWSGLKVEFNIAKLIYLIPGVRL